MEINMKVETNVNVKTLKVHCKVSDCFVANLVSSTGTVLKSYEGYVPVFMPGEHYGDYIILDIDIDTGQITNWGKVAQEEIESFMESK